ncbi:MAG: 30S ribosomal protein S4 [Bacteroidia bacterium]|nr:30S ribosomal protein S4 [Bacteroidia bacterium]
MARYTGPRQKLARRYREPIFGASRALERKNYPPGQHGKNKRGKLSNYGLQLMEKQKAKFIYGILERQFRRIFYKAARMKGSTGDNLIRLLESRLDNTVFRLGFAKTRRGARQLVSHKHVAVNGRVVNIPSYELKPGDVVEVRESDKSLQVVAEALNASMVKKYSWLELNKQEVKGKFLHYPEREQVPENIQERLIVELYSR